jgi:putative flippase GtrA
LALHGQISAIMDGAMQAASAKLEGGLALGYSLAACLGLAVDAVVLNLAMGLGLEAAWARVISLAVAMQVTFLVNGAAVFRCLDRRNWRGAWLGYMVTNGVGNFCNYWTFVTLISLHHPLWSNRWLDLAIGGAVAWLINYGCIRFLIFGVREDGCVSIGEVVDRLRRRLARRTPEHAAESPVRWRDAA